MLLKSESLENRTPRLWKFSITVAALVVVAVVAAVSLVPRAVAEEKPAADQAAAKPADGAGDHSSQNANSTKDELPNKNSTEKPGAGASSAHRATPKADPRQLEIAKLQLEGWKNARDTLTSGIFAPTGAGISSS